MQRKTIFIGTADDAARELVSTNLRHAGYATAAASDGLEILRMVRQIKPDAIVLDVTVLGCDGLEICKKLRKDEMHQSIPIVILSADDTAGERIAGLLNGADDCVAKPFNPRELVLRVEAVIRRSANGLGSELKVGPFHIEPANIKLTVNGNHVDLTVLEYKLMHLLMAKLGGVVNRETLQNEIWGHLENQHTRSLDTHVKRLRSKLGDYADWIQTMRKHGYLCKPPEKVRQRLS